MLVYQRVVRNHGIFRFGISTFQQGTMRAWGFPLTSQGIGSTSAVTWLMGKGRWGVFLVSVRSWYLRLVRLVAQYGLDISYLMSQKQKWDIFWHDQLRNGSQRSPNSHLFRRRPQRSPGRKHGSRWGGNGLSPDCCRSSCSPTSTWEAVSKQVMGLQLDGDLTNIFEMLKGIYYFEVGYSNHLDG